MEDALQSYIFFRGDKVLVEIRHMIKSAVSVGRMYSASSSDYFGVTNEVMAPEFVIQL